MHEQCTLSIAASTVERGLDGHMHRVAGDKNAQGDAFLLYAG